MPITIKQSRNELDMYQRGDAGGGRVKLPEGGSELRRARFPEWIWEPQPCRNLIFQSAPKQGIRSQGVHECSHSWGNITHQVMVGCVKYNPHISL